LLVKKAKIIFHLEVRRFGLARCSTIQYNYYRAKVKLYSRKPC